MNLPNLISLARLLCVPFIISLILSHQLYLALILFTIAGVSDALDGFLARVFKSRTTLGAYLDPIADKVLIFGVYAALGKIGLIETWVMLLVIFRDIIIVGGILFLIVVNLSIEMKPNMMSKLNTVVQLVYAIFILSQADSLFGISFLNQYLGYIVAITTMISGIIYVRLWFRYINSMDLTQT
jgi:cardiolipin synthase